MITIATVVIAAIAVLLLPRSVRIVQQGLVGVVNLAEDGRGQAQILRAEGQKQAAILEAEGRSRAINAVYAAIHDGHPDPELLAVLQLDTLSRFATSPNAKIVIPMESAALMGAAQALRSVLDAVPSANHTPVLEAIGT